jgi:translation elongation factor EF-G
MFSDVVMGVGKKHFEELIDKMKKKKGVEFDVDLTAEDLKELAEEFKSEYTAKAEFLAKTANLTAELFPNEGEAEKEEEEFNDYITKNNDSYPIEDGFFTEDDLPNERPFGY